MNSANDFRGETRPSGATVWIRSGSPAQRVVIDRQDLQPRIRLLDWCGLPWRRFGFGGRVGHRQPHLGDGALAFDALQDETSSRLLGHTVHHRKAEASAFAGALGGEERFRGTRECRLAHAGADIGYR